MIALTTAVFTATWADIRCQKCSRLLLKWHPSGTSLVNVKCPRCGRMDTLRLSTA